MQLNVSAYCVVHRFLCVISLIQLSVIKNSGLVILAGMAEKE